MGADSSRLKARSKCANVLVLGLEGSGKTSLLRKAAQKHQHASKQIIETRGSALVRLTQLGFKLNCLDLGGGPSRRTIWEHYYDRVHAIIFVIDSSDRNLFEKAGKTLQACLEDPRLARVPLLILANKQDRFSAVSGTDISDGLNCSQIRGRLWQIQHTSAATGEGIQTAFAWLARTFCETNLSSRDMKKIRFSAR